MGDMAREYLNSGLKAGQSFQNGLGDVIAVNADVQVGEAISSHAFSINGVQDGEAGEPMPTLLLSFLGLHRFQGENVIDDDVWTEIGG